MTASMWIAVQPVDLLAQLLERRHESGEARALLLDDGGRRARDEALVAELRARLRDLAFVARDLLAEPRALRGLVDLDVQHQPEIADDLDRRVGLRQLGDDAHLGHLAERQRDTA